MQGCSTGFFLTFVSRKEKTMTMSETGNVQFRRASADDVPGIMEIIDYAREKMLEAGKKQWDASYPTLEHISGDLEAGHGYVLCADGEIAAYGAVVFGEEPAYRHIRGGSWLSIQPYVVLHRLAVSGKYKRNGMATRFMAEVEAMMRMRGVHSFKVDTNYDNEAMLSLLDKLQFRYCGEIEYEKGTRMAYEKLI